MVEFIPISKPWLTLNAEKYVLDCIKSGWVSSTGSYVKQFEIENANFYGAQFGVATSNGTTALHLALVALGVGPGDEVIVPDFTFAASINAIIHAGATPVLADVNLDDWTIDISSCQRLLTSRTRAIMPVHILGQPCQMTQVMDFAESNGLWVIEDCAEAHGAAFQNRKVGSWGHISCFSFYGNKIITCGEGGICLTSNEELDQKMRVLRDHGMNKTRRYWHDIVGFNYRMTNMQAALGCSQMENIVNIIGERNKIAFMYDAKLTHIDQLELQGAFPDQQRVCWLYSLRIVDERHSISFIRKALSARQIESRPFFHPLSQMPPYQNLRTDNGCKNVQVICRTGLCLPVFNGMSQNQIESVCDVLIDSLNG